MGKSLRVLIAEDSEDDAMFLLRELRRGGYDVTFERVDTAPAMEAALGKQTWDIVIADYVMPHFSAPDALIILKARGIDLPFIVVSGKIGEDIAVATMKAGAHDYIMKNNLKRLVAAVERELRDVGERQERRRADEGIRRRLDFEKTVSNISSRFVGVFDINDAIDISLADIGRLSGASRSYVFQLSEDGVTMDNTHEWCADGVCSQIENLKGLPLKDFGWWMRKLVKGEVIQVEDVSKMPAEAKFEKEMLEKQEIKSLLVLPLTVGGKLGGFIGFDNVVSTGTWGEEDVTFLRVTSEIIGNALERKKAEEALRRSEEKLKHYLDNSPDAIYTNDLRGNFLYVNRVAERVGWCRKEEIIGRSFLDVSILPQEYLSKAARVLELNAAGKPTGPDEFELIRKNGSRVFVEVSTYPMIEGGKTEVIGIARDITERKRMEEEKGKLEEQLRLASRLAAVGELAAGVAHELNNPIAVIKGFAQLLTARYDLDEAVKEDLGAIYREAQRASKITQNMLSFACRHEPEKCLISINDVLARSLDLCAYQMKVENIEMMVEFDPDLPKIMADFHQMQEVFVNIIVNAEQAMVEAHGRGSLMVKTQRVDKMAQITFTDDGPGIPEEDLKRIFDPFFTTKDVGKGSGLGLSICYGLVEGHGGRIYARSKLGEGAAFVVEIPIVTDNKLAANAFI